MHIWQGFFFKKPNDFVFFVDFQVRTLELVLRKLFVYINDTRFKIIYKGKLTSSHTKVEKKKLKNYTSIRITRGDHF